MAQDFWGWVGTLFGGNEQKAAPARPQTAQKATRSFSSPAAPPAAAGLARGGGGGVGSPRSMNAPAPADRPSSQPEQEEPTSQGTLPPGRTDGQQNRPTGSLPEGNLSPREATGTLPRGGEQKARPGGSVPGTTVKPEAPAPPQWANAAPQQKQLTWEEYDALNPRQRAAVDANTALFNAITADKAEFDSGVRSGGAEYSQSVDALFGSGGDTAAYAPRTVAVLQALNGNARDPENTRADRAGGGQYFGEGAAPLRTGSENIFQGDSLQSVLSGQRLITEADLSSLTNDNWSALSSQGQGALSNKQTQALRFSEASLDSMSRTLQAGQGLLDVARNGTTGLFDDPEATVGFNPLDQTGRDEGLNYLFDVAAQRDSGLTPAQFGEVVGGLGQEFGVSPEQVRQYLDTRLKAADYGTAGGNAVQLGSDPNLSYISPDEFRARYYGGQ